MPTRAISGLVIEEIVAGLQPAVAEIGEDLLHPALGLAKEDRVGVGHGLLGMEHGGDAAEDHLDALFPVDIGDLPAPFHLHGQHHRDADEIDRVVEIDGFKVLVDEVDIDIVGQGGGKDHRAVRRQVEFGLPGQFRPSGIDQFEFHERYQCTGCKRSALTRCMLRV